MNEKARELGATNTNFVNPCGIDNGEKEKSSYHGKRSRQNSAVCNDDTGI